MKKKHILLILSLVIASVGIGVTAATLSEERGNDHNKSESVNVEVKQSMVGSLAVDKISFLIHKINEIHNEDNGLLWGKPLNTRIMFIDPQSNSFIASEQDSTNSLTSVGEVFAGKLPEDTIFANSTLTYGGKEWATVIWDDSYSEEEQLVLCLHEMFHNVEKELNIGYDKKGEFLQYNNDHMDEMEARVWLKLEWEALHKALNSKEQEVKKSAIEDALFFRKVRQTQYNSVQNESRFETHEGLAEYNGQRLTYGKSEKQVEALNSDFNRVLDESLVPSYVRAFAYHSGPLYSVLLDEVDENWRKNITGEIDLGECLRKAYNIEDLEDNLEERQARYGYDEIYSYEKQRKEKRDQKIAEYKAQFNEESVRIPIENINISFNPNTIWDLGEQGQVYEGLMVKADVGMLEVDGAALLSNDWDMVTVSSQDLNEKDNIITGKGWRLTLNNGYSLVQEGKGYRIQ